MIDIQLCNLVRSLPLPSNYFKGQRNKLPNIPDNILCWHPHELFTGGPAGYHQHYRFVLMIPVKGTVTVVLDENMFGLSPGHSLLCFPFQQHAFVDAETDRAWLFVTFELSEHEHLTVLRNRLIRIGENCHRIAADLIKSYLAQHRHNQTCLLTALLLDELIHNADPAEKPLLGGTSLGLLEKANQVIWRSLHQPLDIQQLADECAISASHLRLLFRTKFQKSLGHYIRETKINRSVDLLATTTMSVSEIAEACGFSSLYTFSRAFKRVTGVSPRQYRDRAKVK